MTTENINQPAPGIPATVPSADAPSIAELDFLKQHGEDVSDLYAGLEQVLRRGDQSDPAPVSAPLLAEIARDQPVLRSDGTLIERPAAPATAQEKALDPYAPEGTKQAPLAEPSKEELEPGEVMVDAEGKLRDAKTGKYVPHAALHQERERRKEIETELSRVRDEWARGEERLKLLTELALGQEAKDKKAAEPAPAEPEKEIDPEVDIFGWAQQQRRRAEAAEKRILDLAKQHEQQYGEIQTQNKFRQDVTSFASTNPDFFDAHRHLTDVRKLELKALGFTDDTQIAKQILAEERLLVQNALEAGGSPATIFYNLSKAKGYSKAVPAVPAAEATPAPVPAAPAPAQQAAPVPQPSAESRQQVQNIQNGLNASASLSGVGGTSGEGLTMQQIADMPEDDFMVLMGKLGLKKFDKLLGGR